MKNFQMRIATMDDFDRLNHLYRVQHKTTFPYLTKDNIKERIKAGAAYISVDKMYSEIIRIYRRKTKFIDYKGEEHWALPGDVKLWLAASVNPGKGTGTKYRKQFLKILCKRNPGIRMFSTLRSKNSASERYNIKCGGKLLCEYVKNGNKYKTYVHTSNTCGVEKAGITKYLKKEKKHGGGLPKRRKRK